MFLFYAYTRKRFRELLNLSACMFVYEFEEKKQNDITNNLSYKTKKLLYKRCDEL